MLLIIFKELTEFAPCIAWVVGHKGMERKFEKTVEGDSSCIDGSDACRCQHNIFLLGVLTDVFQESRFTCSRLSREEKGVGSELNKIQCIPKLRILGVDFYLHKKSIFIYHSIRFTSRFGTSIKESPSSAVESTSTESSNAPSYVSLRISSLSGGNLP